MRSARIAILVGLLASAATQAQTPEDRGLVLAKIAQTRGQGFGDASVSMKMILRNPQGEEAVRELRSRVMEVKGDGDKTLIVFDTPKDVRGTALLTHAHKTATDERWLYLPALKRVKRIASSNQSGAFMGSEFAYEDFGAQTLEKYHYKYLRAEKFDGVDCDVIERVPVDADSGYKRQQVWMDQAEQRPRQVEYYDRKNKLLKTLSLKDYQQHLGQFWRPARMDVVNHQSGKSTTLLFSDYKFKSGYTARDFDQNTLQSLR